VWILSLRKKRKSCKKIQQHHVEGSSGKEEELLRFF
jgi:hypothetical protein